MKNRVDRLVHDIRNPLNSISINAELACLLHQSGSSPEKLEKALRTILRECANCSLVVENFRQQLVLAEEGNTDMDNEHGQADDSGTPTS